MQFQYYELFVVVYNIYLNTQNQIIGFYEQKTYNDSISYKRYINILKKKKYIRFLKINYNNFYQIHQKATTIDIYDNEISKPCL